MNRPFDIAVFDFDGTLVQSNDVKQEGFHLVAEAYEGGAEAMQATLSIPGLDRHAIVARFADLLGLDSACAQRIAARYTRLVDQRVIDAPECAGAGALLAALNSSAMRVHLSSATPLSSLRHIVDRRGWTDMFDGIHGRPSTKEATLAALLADTGTEPGRVVVIGDGLDDRASADALQTAFIAVGDRLTDGPTQTLDEVRERLVPC